MYKVFINGKPLVITNNTSLFEKKKAVIKRVFTTKESLNEAVKQAVESENDPTWIYAFDINQCWENFKKNFKCIDAAGGIVRNDKQEILFIYRRKKWDLPKGKTEKGESLHQTALREVEEECGITVNLHTPNLRETTYHTYKENGKLVLKSSYWYLMDLAEDSPTPVPQTEEDIEKVRWLHPENLSMVYNKSFINIIDLCKKYQKDFDIISVL